MKVLLVRLMAHNIIGGFGAIECEPLELEYLLAACRAVGIEGEIYDGVTERRRFSDVLRAGHPDAVAITGYLTQEGQMRACAGLVRRVLPRCRVLLGGTHVQLNYRRLQWDEVDVLVRGEDSRDFAALLRCLEAGAPFDHIPGLCWQTETGWRESAYVPCDIEGLPLPDRGGWAERANWYHYLDLPRLATVKTAVSCPYACTFCYGTHLHGGQYQARSVDSVLEELEGLEAEHVFLVDSDFLIEAGRLEELLDGLERRKIRKTFVCYARADFIASHPDLTARLCRAGFLWFLVGIEAVEDERLEGWGKGTGGSVNDTCIRILKENGAFCVALMIADLSFRKADFDAVYRWVKGRGLRYASVQVLTPLPATPLHDQWPGGLDESDYARWDLAHPVAQPQFLSRAAFLRHYRQLLARLIWLGWRRGGYRFATPRYLLRVLLRRIRRGRGLT